MNKKKYKLQIYKKKEKKTLSLPSYKKYYYTNGKNLKKCTRKMYIGQRINYIQNVLYQTKPRWKKLQMKLIL